MTGGWVGSLRALGLSVSVLLASAACTAIFGSDLDEYRIHDGKHEQGGHFASGGSGSGSGAGSGGSTGGAETNRDASSGGLSANSGGTPAGGSGGSRVVDSGAGSGGGADSRTTGGRPSGSPDAWIEAGPTCHAPDGSPPIGSTWNDLNWFVPIFVCFTTKPHLEWDGTRQCEKQLSFDQSCSGDPFTGTDVSSLRVAFMSLIQEAWARATNLEFYDNECPDNGRGMVDLSASNLQLAVTFTTKGSDKEPLTEAVTGLGRHPYASDLHVDWQGLRDRDPDALRTILRETGRVLGFPYEWLRGNEQDAPEACPPDLPKECATLTRPAGLTDYFSVMDRCTPTYPGLSPGDVIGAQGVYGIKQSGGIVGYRGYCVDVEEVDTSPGAPVVGFPCRNAENDTFCRCSRQEPRFEATFGGVKRCLTVKEDAMLPDSFTAVVSDPCDGREAQRFTTSDLEWRAMGNLCLVPQNSGIELAFCDGSTGQRWNFWDVDPSTTPDWDQIQYAPTGGCVTTQTTVGTFGEKLRVVPCSTTDRRQRFQYLGDGVVNFGSWCLSVFDRHAPASAPLAPGTPLALQNCNDRTDYSSRFYVSGNFKALGQCLATKERPYFLDLVGVEACKPNDPRQIWDFYF